jgi:hypothetical protein
VIVDCDHKCVGEDSIGEFIKLESRDKNLSCFLGTPENIRANCSASVNEGIFLISLYLFFFGKLFLILQDFLAVGFYHIDIVQHSTF